MCLLPAGLVIIIGALAVSLFFKRGFCGWICPLGTVWEAFAAAGRRLMGKNIRVPRWLDLTGRTFRYILSALIVFMLLVVVPVSEAVNFRLLPYMWVADIKTISMMIEPVYLLVILFAGLLSLLFGPVWCRYLCPVGGIYSAVGELSPCKVVRNDDACIHCSRCDKVCHAFVRVEASKTVNDTECDGCMDCVKICPAENCLEARGPRPGRHRSLGVAGSGGWAVACDIRGRLRHRQLEVPHPARAVQSRGGVRDSRAAERAPVACCTACSEPKAW